MRFKEKVKGDNNRRKAYTYLTKNKGLEPHIASGLVANLMQESYQLNRTWEEGKVDDVGSMGIMQWHGKRLSRLYDFYKKKNKEYKKGQEIPLEAQLDYIMYEAETGAGEPWLRRQYNKAFQANNAEEAAILFSKYVLRPHEDHAYNDKRVRYAKNIYNTFVGDEENYVNEPSEVITEEERTEWNAYTPMTEEEYVDYSTPIINNPIQIPYLDLNSVEDSRVVGTEETQTPIVDDAISRIEDKKNQMAELQRLIKMSEVQFINQSGENIPEANSYGYPSIQEGGEIKKAQKGTEVTISQHTPQPLYKKAWDVLTNPATALEHLTKTGTIPDNLDAAVRNGQGERNILDTALDVVNPLAMARNVANIPNDVKQGNYLTAAGSALDVVPMGATAKKVLNKKVISNIDDLLETPAFLKNKSVTNYKTNFKSSKLGDEGFEGSPRNLTQDEIASTINKEMEYLKSPEYLKKRMANTGETKEQILKEINTYTKNMDNTTISFESGMGNEGSYYSGDAGIGKFFGMKNQPRVRVGVDRGVDNTLNTLQHEVNHGLSPLSVGNNKAYKNYPSLDVGDIPDRKYQMLPEEQQVRLNKIGTYMEDKHGLKRGQEFTDRDIDKLLLDLNRNSGLSNGKYEDAFHFLHTTRRAANGKTDYKKILKEALNKSWGVVPVAGVAGATQMQEGGETDPNKQQPITEEEYNSQTYGIFATPSKENKEVTGSDIAPLNPVKTVIKRGREKQPLNLRVQETTGVRRNNMDFLLTPIVEQEYDEFTDPSMMNYQDILNPTEVVYDKGKADLKAKVSSKSELLNPMGMDKIDPNSLQDEESVKRLQSQLIENGYDLGEYGADGKVGPKTMSAINKFNSKIALSEELSVGDFKAPEQVEELQEFLITKGFDLNPNGRFANGGIDGKLGKVTEKALLDYNKKAYSDDRLPYKGVKDGDGFLGACAEEQCSEYVQNEIWRNISPDVSRAEWNKQTGLSGDAWTIGNNIVKAGGRKIQPEEIAGGDVVTIFTGGGSPYQAQANREGTGTTHTAVTDQTNDDGTYYILHNVHAWSPTGWKGQEYRDLVSADGVILEGPNKGFQVKGIYRPTTDEKGKVTKPLRKDIELAIDPDRAEQLSSIGSFLGSAPEKIKEFVEPLNNFKNKEKFSQIFELEEDEYQSLAQLTIGVLGQESNFGTNPVTLIKEPIAKMSWFANKMTDGNFADSPIMKADEVSEGAGRLKFNTNFHADLTEFGINKSNFDKDKNVPITSMYKLATDYKRFRKKGLSKKDALYRAAVVYNASLSGESEGKTREEWAQEYDVDYANKAITFASALGVQGEDRTYKTIIDDLLLEDNVYKWRKDTYKGRN